MNKCTLCLFLFLEGLKTAIVFFQLLNYTKQQAVLKDKKKMHWDLWPCLQFNIIKFVPICRIAWTFYTFREKSVFIPFAL